MAQPKTRTKIVEALMALAAERPWDEIALDAVAARAGVNLATLRGAYDGRLAIFADFVRRIDEHVLEAVDPDMAGEAPRERLFDVLFGRFEQLRPHRAAIRNLARAACRDPLLALALNRITTGSMVWMLAGAGIRATGGEGLMRAQGLALVWAQTLRVWLDDDDPGLSRTMAELDRQLRRGERALIRLDCLKRVLCLPRARRSERPAPAPDVGLAEGHPT